MIPLILTTKIHVPPLRHAWLDRPRLIDALNANVFDHAFSLVSAPAGYGKTTLVSQWAHQQDPRNIAWVTLETTENNPDSFLRYLVAAWDQTRPGILESPVGLLAGSTSPDLDTVLQHFVNVAASGEANLVFVLDDLHYIDNDSVLQALSFLIEHLPASAHIIATCRGVPPLPMARLRAKGMLFEISADDLAFDQQEARWLLSSDGAPLSEEQIAEAQKQLDGWVAGLQLFSHARQQGSDPVQLLSAGGKQRFLADYLRQEVIDSLSPEQRQFLLRTSILDRLCGDLCDQVLAETGSQSLLEALEHQGLFLQPLDETRTWFRYHPVFADVLREQLERDIPDFVSAMHRNAAGWYLEHGMPNEAFEHAVSCRDVTLLLRIIEDYTIIKLESGEIHTVARWVQQIPESWYEVDPSLNLLRVPYLIYSGAFDEGARLLEAVEQQLQSVHGEDVRSLFGKIATARCAIACFLNDLPLAESYASAALRDLAPDDRIFRAGVYHALGETYARNAFWEKAAALLKQALSIWHEPSSLIRSVHIYGALADLDLRQGRLHDGEANWQKAMVAIQSEETWGRLPLPVTGWVCVRLAELHFERNHLSDAEILLERGLELAQLGGEPRSLLAGNLLAARICISRHHANQAEAYLDRARSIVDKTQFAEWNARFDRMQIELWLAQGRFREIAEWTDRQQNEPVDPLRVEPEIAQLTLARALIVLGDDDHVNRARTILHELRELAVVQGRLAIHIEASALEAIAMHATASSIALEHALRLAITQGYIRLFADLGQPMRFLLQEARARGVMPEYIDQILAACSDNGSAVSDRPAPLIEALSARERQVLELLAAGLTNAEIAGRLFISPETIKKHTSSIYAKLAVRRRTEAVAKARELGLLDLAS